MNSWVVSINEPTADQAGAFSLFLQTKPDWAFWHYIGNLWIVMAPAGITAEMLFNEAQRCAPEKNAIVIAIADRHSYFGRFHKDGHDWFSASRFIG